MKESYTGVTLEFLRKTRWYHHGTKSTAFTIGNLNEPETHERMLKALRRVQVVVQNIQQLMQVYRPEDSWLALFTAFGLPGGCVRRTEKLQRIIK